uniref:Tudor domain-containing protein n=1 Tax=Pristionchus pacificus TaxID=54126 RepID=A0A8R1Z6E9_PRIPA
MSISHRFINSDGLIPTTIFDGGDADMDISEEMEEIRELLYETIKKKFPRGVASDHLAKVYKEAYVDSGLGPELPSNWLSQVKAAEEFEAQSRGPLTILFVRLHNGPTKKTIAPSSVVSPSPIVSIGKDQTTPSHSPIQLAAMLSQSKEVIIAGSQVIVVAFTHSNDFYIRLESSHDELVKLKNHLKSEYSTSKSLSTHDMVVNGAYALKDSQGEHFRIIALSPPTLSSSVQCFFVDIGVRGSFPLSNLRHLNCESVEMCSTLATRVSLSIEKEDVHSALRHILFTHDENGDPTPTSFEIVSIENEDRSGCRMIEIKDRNGKSIHQLLTESVQGGKENENKEERGLPSHLNLPAIGGVSDFDSWMEMGAMGVDGMPRRPFLAHAIYASGPGEISLRQASLDPMPEYLYDRLNEECNDPSSALKGLPQPGRFYAANVNGVWQRVQCVRSSKIDPNTFLLYLVDVGAFHYSRPSTIRRLNSLSPFKKMLIFKCKLFGVSPMGAADVWSREAQMAVNDFLDKCDSWPVEVVPRSEWSGWNQLNAPSLPLVEASIRSREGRDLADWLVYNRLAQPSI